MDANTPPPDRPDPPDTAGVSAQDSWVRPPNDRDPDIDEASSVSDIIEYGRHSLDMGGRGSRVEYLWRRRAFKALHYLRVRRLTSKEYADAAQSFGVESRSEAFKLAHLWSIIDDVDAWATAKANESKRRRGIEKWPSNNAILTEFPSPNRTVPRSREEKEEEKREEEEARARAKAGRNSGGDDETLDADALSAEVAKLRAEVEWERTARLDNERMLTREREVAEAALNAALERKEVAPGKPQVDERVSNQDSHDPRQLDLFSDPDPVVPEPATIKLSADAVAPEERDDIERHHKLATGWAGRSSPSGDIQARNVRAHFYREWGTYLSPDAAKVAQKLPKKTWRDSATVADVLTRLAASMAEPETPEPEMAEGE